MFYLKIILTIANVTSIKTSIIKKQLYISSIIQMNAMCGKVSVYQVMALCVFHTDCIKGQRNPMCQEFKSLQLCFL